jgi:hypothetical protein
VQHILFTNSFLLISISIIYTCVNIHIKCGLSGPLPKSICNLTKLKMLNLDDNKLTGPLPRLHWPKPGSNSKEDLAGGLRALTLCTEIGLAHNR